jgi:hypothetical protein
MSTVAIGATFQEVEQHVPNRQVPHVADGLLEKRQDPQDSLDPCEGDEARAPPNGTEPERRGQPSPAWPRNALLKLC